MATAKKAVVAKKAAIPAKVGAKVKATKRDETVVSGVIVGINPGAKGTWISVDTAKGKNAVPDITKFPASKVKVLAAA